jgi:uncharacterized protein
MMTAAMNGAASMLVRTFALVILSLWFALGTAWAQPVYPELTGRVVDDAGLLSAADKAALETELAAFEAKTTDQIVVATVRSLNGYPIDDYGIGLARKWGLGQKGKDNGVLILVAPTERKVRIDVGRRLEPLLPDGKVGTIIRSTILPVFRRGDFPGGIKAGVAAVQASLSADKAEADERAKRPPPPFDYMSLLPLVLFGVIVIFVIRAQQESARQWAALTPQQRNRILADRARQRRLEQSQGPIIFPGGSGGWSGGSGGGGGFSGGGGDFGGGGASGDW